MTNLNTIKKLVNNKFHNADTIEVSDYNERESEVVFSVNTENNITMVSILKGLVEGLKGQRIYVERFIGCNTSTIVIENPILNTDGYDFQDKYDTGVNYGSGVNTIDEINIHELCGVAPLRENWDDIQDIRS